MSAQRDPLDRPSGSVLRWIIRVLLLWLVAFQIAMCAVCIASGLWFWPGIPNVVLLLITITLAWDAWTQEALR